MNAENIAHVAHQIVSAYHMSQGDGPYTSWTEASLQYRARAIDTVVFLLETPYTDTRQAHELWMTWRLNSDWTYGPEYDMAMKTDPLLKPLDELPSVLKANVYLVVAVVESLCTYDLESL